MCDPKKNWEGGGAESTEGNEQPAECLFLLRHEQGHGSGEQESDGGDCRENIAGELGFGNGEEEQAEARPTEKQDGDGRNLASSEATGDSVKGGPEEGQSPRKGGDQQDREVKPEGLDVLEFGSEEAVEIVFDDEDAEEVGVAAGAEDVPGKSGETEACDGDGVKAAEGVRPTFGENGPEKDRAAREDDGSGTFGKGSEAEEKTEEKGGKGG